MRPAERALFQAEIKRYEEAHPDVRIQALYKETEELRSAFQAAALGGAGPELIYGPSDVLDTFQTMGVIQDMQTRFPAELLDDFSVGALTYLPKTSEPAKMELVQIGDRFGNHLALVYNRRFVSEPPTTTDELVAVATKNTFDEDGDGRNDRYGLVWNFTEPFFGIPFLTGFGAWVFESPQQQSGHSNNLTLPVPALDSPEAVSAYQFIKSLRDEHRVVPNNCDYELADSLFKTGRAAMIINGDWSWAEYLDNPAIDAAVAVLPIVSATGLPMQSMISPKGFSLNANVQGQLVKDAMEFVGYMVSDEVQRRLVEELRMMPARESIRQDRLFEFDPTLRVSLDQLERGRLMPVASEMRAIWDAMRPNYQALLGGATTPQEAAAAMQHDARSKISDMHRTMEPDRSVIVVEMIGAILFGLWIVAQRRNIGSLIRDWRRNRLAYLFAFPAVIAIFLVVIFPFVYNIALSMSDMSLSRFKDWRIVGLHNYTEVLTDANLWTVFFKTVIWTVVNVAFHVGLGLLLAIALNGSIRGKPLYRVLLIIPWAVPAYITALTWRGMFDYEYGAANLLLFKAAQLPAIEWLLQKIALAPPVNWLGEPIRAFEACIIANVWLGFPFMMVIALGGLQGIPIELYEAARIDRASRWQQFWHITLPLLKPVLMPAITLGMVWTFNNLNIIWLVSNGGEPQDSTHILVSYVYKAVFNLYRYGYGAALSMVMFILLLVLSMVFLRQHRATEGV